MVLLSLSPYQFGNKETQTNYCLIVDQPGWWTVLCYELVKQQNSVKMILVLEYTLSQSEAEIFKFLSDRGRGMISIVRERLAQYLWNMALKKGYWFNYLSLEYDVLFDALTYWKFSAKFLSQSNRRGYFKEVVSIIAGKSSYRTVRRAIYRSIEKRVQSKGWYDPIPDIVICYSFDDPNLIVRFLNMEIKNSMFKNMWHVECYIYFFKLLQKFYKPSEIVRSIEQSISYVGYFYTPDWVTLLQEVEVIFDDDPEILGYMKKSRMRPKSLYDEIMHSKRYAYIAKSGLKYFDYSVEEKKLEGKFNAFEFRLPSTNLELQEWSWELHNCLGRYENNILDKMCLILGVFVEDTLTYALEISTSQTLLQARGKYNKLIEEEILEEICNTLNLSCISKRVKMI